MYEDTEDIDPTGNEDDGKSDEIFKWQESINTLHKLGKKVDEDIKEDKEIPTYEDFYKEVLKFRLGEEEYGIELSKINELLKFKDLVVCEIPGVAPFIRGIISLRGTIVPVLDLRRRLKLGDIKDKEESFNRRVIVATEKGIIFGMLVDYVSRVVKVNENEMQDPPLGLGDVEAEFILKVGRYTEKQQRVARTTEEKEGSNLKVDTDTMKEDTQKPGTLSKLGNDLDAKEKEEGKSKHLVAILNLPKVIDFDVYEGIDQ